MMRTLLSCLCTLAVIGPATATGIGDEPLRRAADEDWMVKHDFAGFLAAHPDQFHHRIGARHYRDGEHADAMRHFRRAARFADKPSQAMIAEMFWNGHGVAVDRATAYAWMDLAAERDYPLLVQAREAFWRELDEAERARALQVGHAIYAEFGDAVAQKRIAAVLRRGQRNAVGSRTGFRGNASIFALPPGSANIPSADPLGVSATSLAAVNSRDFYADTYWDSRQYFRWRELQWQELHSGYSEVGPLRATDTPAAPRPTPDVDNEVQEAASDIPPPRSS